MLCADAERRDAAQLCARIKSVLSEPFEVQGETITLGASIGFVAEEAVTDAEELIHRADAAMYAEKRYRAVAT
jgi:GGDEF domain-containing protein